MNALINYIQEAETVEPKEVYELLCLITFREAVDYLKWNDPEGDYTDMTPVSAKLQVMTIIWKATIREANFTLRNIAPQSNAFHNFSLKGDVLVGEFNYPSLYYSLEKSDDPYNVFWKLAIVSSSLAELEGCEEGIIAEYIYHDEDEAKQDLAFLEETVSTCTFEEL